MAKIELPDTHLDDLIKLYEGKCEEYGNILKSLKAAKTGTTNTANDAVPNSTTQKPQKKGFAWRPLIIEILRNSDILLETDEIYNKALLIHDSLKEKARKSAISSISSTLSVLVKNGKLGKVTHPTSGGNLWGLASWFEGESLKTEYVRKLSNSGIIIPIQTEDDGYSKAAVGLL